MIRQLEVSKQLDRNHVIPRKRRIIANDIVRESPIRDTSGSARAERGGNRLRQINELSLKPGADSVRSLDLPQRKSCSTESLQVELEWVDVLVPDGQSIVVLVANWEATAEICIVLGVVIGQRGAS